MFDASFVARVRDVCKGEWQVETTYDGAYMARCIMCKDTINGMEQIMKLVIPGYHCWCDR